MSLIKVEPTEGESPLNVSPPLPHNESTVKCEWSLKESCACADGQCEDCQAATEKEDEKDDILTMTPAAASSRNSQENDETEFHPPEWENCEAAENTDNASDAANEDVKPVFGPVGDNLGEGTVIEKVSSEEIKEEINDNAEKEIVNEEAEMQVEAIQVAVHVGSDLPLVVSRGSTRPKERFTNVNVIVPAVEEAIVKSESEEEVTLTSQLPIISPPEEINEEISENAEEGNVCEETEMQVEASPMQVHVFKDILPALAIDGILAEVGENEPNSNHQPSIIQQADTEQRNQEVIANNEKSEIVNTEPEQAEATVVSSLSLRRSTRVRKRPVNYAVLPEAEEEAHQDEPNTGTSDSEESDTDESETEIDSEMETDAQSGIGESNTIAAEGDGSLSRKVFPCRHCEKKFSFKHHVRYHEKTHQSERPRPFACSLADCGKAFLAKAHLDVHRLIHSGKKPFTCTTCGESFKQKGSLKRHQSTHTDERPYACALCPKAFKGRTALVQHNRLHSGLKPFTCVDCGGSFTLKGTLEQHRKRKIASAGRYAPSESRPFSCTVAGCGRAFKEKGNLNVHIRAHSGVKAFTCTVCGGKFTRKGNLKKHNRKIHGII